MKGFKKVFALALILAALLPLRAAGAEAPIRIAFIDSGISTKHIDKAKVAVGVNYVFPESDTEDRIGHGTATAGLVLGAEDQDVAGACPDAVAVPLVVVDVYPSGARKNGGTEALCRAIRDAVDLYGCKIVNVSLCTTENTEELRKAAEYAESRGVVLIAAVGNDGEDGPVFYPAAYDTVVAVGSADGEGAASFSQNGADLLAEDVPLVTATNKNGKTPTTVEGTSYSCSLVTAVCARLLSARPDLTPKQAREELFAMCKDVLEPGFDERSGWGVLPADPEIPQAGHATAPGTEADTGDPAHEEETAPNAERAGEDDPLPYRFAIGYAATGVAAFSLGVAATLLCMNRKKSGGRSSGDGAKSGDRRA